MAFQQIKLAFKLMHIFIFETGRKYSKHLKYSLEKVGKRLKNFSSHAPDGSHAKIKVSDNPTH